MEHALQVIKYNSAGYVTAFYVHCTVGYVTAYHVHSILAIKKQQIWRIADTPPRDLLSS